ncbi:hypothetical protein WJX73_001845 [Symbiochloris irregularis]|uniref:ATP phosphoribosyltransferase n=1 Tax=Symbiochloris irregularis TaxID=706552 RepID=A0AAW1NWY7_9CHLO
MLLQASLSNSSLPGIEQVVAQPASNRTALRLAIPSKGRLAEDTLRLLQDCQLPVYKPNPRQYIAVINQMPNLEVWFQRASDVVRKLVYGDVDLGIVGYDMFQEIAGTNPDLIVLHDALAFGKCHLALGVPIQGRFADVHTLDDLRSMKDWTERTPLRVVTGYHNIARRYFEEKGFEHVVLLSADGALEAAPLMGTADIILDLVSTGVTLRENNLKELDGATIFKSQCVLVGSRRALLDRPGLLNVAHELIERLEAHLKASDLFSVVANMRGDSPEEVAERLLASPELQGLQGPTIAPIYTQEHIASSSGGNSTGSTRDGKVGGGKFYAATVCVPQKRLYESVKQLRKLGGSGVLVMPMTYVFDEEPERWRRIMEDLESHK